VLNLPFGMRRDSRDVSNSRMLALARLFEGRLLALTRIFKFRLLPVCCSRARLLKKACRVVLCVLAGVGRLLVCQCASSTSILLFLEAESSSIHLALMVCARKAPQLLTQYLLPLQLVMLRSHSGMQRNTSRRQHLQLPRTRSLARIIMLFYRKPQAVVAL